MNFEWSFNLGGSFGERERDVRGGWGGRGDLGRTRGDPSWREWPTGWPVMVLQESNLRLQSTALIVSSQNLLFFLQFAVY